MNNSSPEVSIVIVTYRRPGLAQRVFEMLLSHNVPYQIIVVDQENTSGISDEEARALGMQIINLPEGNISEARNTGLREAHAPIVLYIDDDIEISKESIQAHLMAYEDPNVVAVAGRVINDGDITPIETNVLTGKTNLFGTQFIQQFWSTKKQEVDFPYGCNMSFRTEVLRSVGGFDPAFPRVFDDIDIGFRVKKYGTILFDPEALAYHHKAASGGSRPDKSHHELLYRYYGYYLGKNIVFPLSIISLVVRIITVMKESPSSLGIFITSWVRGILRKYHD